MSQDISLQNRRMTPISFRGCELRESRWKWLSAASFNEKRVTTTPVETAFRDEKRVTGVRDQPGNYRELTVTVSRFEKAISRRKP